MELTSQGTIPGSSKKAILTIVFIFITKTTHSWFFRKLHSSFNIKQIQFSSAAQSCLTLCDPMNCSIPGLPVHYQLPDFTQTPVHQVGDAIQPSHPLSSPSPAFNLSPDTQLEPKAPTTVTSEESAL